MTRRSTTPVRTSIDARRQLRPRDYATDPYGFGERNQVFATPVGGDDISRTIAELIHEVVRATRAQPAFASGAELGRRFGFSRQTWSRVIHGYQWPGHTVMSAMLDGLREAASTPGDRTVINRAASSGQRRNSGRGAPG